MKRIMKFIMTSKNKEELNNKAIESRILESSLIKNKLNEWYLRNKDRVEKDNSDILNVSFNMDEETERIYKLFISDSMNNLINNRNMSCATSYKEFEESWIESARLQSLDKKGYSSLVMIDKGLYVVREKFSDIQTSENMNLVAEFNNGIFIGGLRDNQLQNK